MMQLGVSYDPPAWRTAQLSQPRRSRRAPARGARTGVSQPSAVLRPNTRVKIVQRGETSPEEISRRSLIAAAAAACGCCASSVVTGGKIPGSSSDDSAKTWSQPLFAEEMAKGMRDYEARLRPLKCALFTGGQDDQQSPSTPPGLAGAPQLQPAPAGGLIAPGSRVLEIGVGAAPNFRYYSSASSVTALEPNEAFYPLIRDAAAANGLADRLRLVPGTAEKMPFDSGSFDVVVATMVLCSCADVRAVAREVRRVLRPGGVFASVEHVAAPRWTPLWALQTALDPLQQGCFAGCHLTRDPLPALLAAGFASVDSARFTLGGAAMRAEALRGAAGARVVGRVREAEGAADGGAMPMMPPPPHFLLSPHLISVCTAG